MVTILQVCKLSAYTEGTMSKFYTFGLQRSGTTFVGEIIKNSYGLDYANKENTWKHMLYPLIEFDHPVVTVIKHPYTWVESIAWREPADLPKTSPYITDPGDYVIDNSYGECPINVEQLIKVYKSWWNQWLNVGLMVKYEDMIVDPFHQLIDVFGSPAAPYIPEPGSLFMSEGYNDDYDDYYINEEPQKLEQNYVEMINDILGQSFFDITQYKMLTFD